MSSNIRTGIVLLLMLTVLPLKAVETLDVSLEKGQLLLTPRHGGDGSAWGNENCSACHFSRSIHSEAPVIRNIVREVGFSTCTGCHGSNGTEAERKCTICHNPQRLPTAPIMTAPETHDFSVKESVPLNDRECLICHHSSDMDGVFEPDIDLSYFPHAQPALDLPYRSGVEFCLRCHNKNDQQPGYEMQARFPRDPLVDMDVNYQHYDVHGYQRGSGQRTYTGLRSGSYQYGDLLECTDCHAMHGTHNPKLILDRTDAGATKLAPEIRNLPVLINVVDGDYSQLCVSCHDMNTLVEQGAENTGNGLSGVHQFGTDCRQCHVHGMAVQTGL